MEPDGKQVERLGEDLARLREETLARLRQRFIDLLAALQALQKQNDKDLMN